MIPVARSHDWRERQAGLTDFARAAMPYPLTFATLSGADLYGFPSADGDYDVRAAHVLPLREIASLEPRLNEAYERSALSDCTLPEVWAAAEDLLFRCRLAEGG